MMRLRALSMQNFKGFGEQTTVPLSNITLLYGANSAGKSSIIQSLMLMKQTLVPMAGAYVPDLEFRGPLVDLGGFQPCITAHDIKRPLVLGLELSGGESAHRFGIGDHVHYSFEHAWDPDLEAPRLTRVEFRDVPSRRALSWQYREATAGLHLATPADSKTMLDAWVNNLPQRNYPLDANADDISFVRTWLRRTATDMIGWIPSWSPRELLAGKPGRPVGGSLASNKRLLLQSVVYDWQSVAFSTSYSIESLLENAHYVGPLRQAPRRVQVDSGSVAQGMGVRGERAGALLARDAHLLARVNLALEMLEVPYEVISENFGSTSIASAIGEVSALILRDRRTGVTVTPGDVGFGISQILPVVLQLLLTHNGTICVEQPEIHLHPRLQARLADIIIASATLRGNQVIIETHSEHLLLRLQRRIRSRSISAGDVQVLYVDQSARNSVITRVELDDKGQMQTTWPSGFFDERLDDLLANDAESLQLDLRLGD